jgi:hypothetical protein
MVERARSKMVLKMVSSSSRCSSSTNTFPIWLSHNFELIGSKIALIVTETAGRNEIEKSFHRDFAL